MLQLRPKERAAPHCVGPKSNGPKGMAEGVVQALDREHFADLMEAIAERQDRDAFAEIFAFYAPRVKAYVLRLGAGETLAEEIAQEVMIVVWRKAQLFDRRQASVS